MIIKVKHIFVIQSHCKFQFICVYLCVYVCVLSLYKVIKGKYILFLVHHVTLASLLLRKEPTYKEKIPSI